MKRYRKDKAENPEKEKPEKNKKAADSTKSAKDTYDWIQSLTSALMFCVIVFVFFIRLVYVNGNSMYPTLNNNDLMLVSRFLYTPDTGDIVVFKKDSYDENKALVKRVIATEGQVINMNFETGQVFVDGVELKEDYIRDLTHNKLDFIGPQTVPEGCVFVMGDNRNESTDSRNILIGMVDARLIIGKVLYVVYPLDEFHRVQ
ncbi:MAG: signal peptidase I [Oscillospiraceae bacterium]|nr:signal peptidase I [Oscillospiraceae bacterium]